MPLRARLKRLEGRLKQRRGRTARVVIYDPRRPPAELPPEERLQKAACTIHLPANGRDATP